MRDNYLRTEFTNGISHGRVYRANARDNKVSPNGCHTSARSEVARVSFESSEDIEELAGTNEAAASAFDAMFIEWVGHERHRNASADKRASDGQQRIKVAVGTVAGDHDIHLLI
jgi:hypothetical protein